MSSFLLGNERGENLISILVASIVLVVVFMVSMPSLMKSYTDSKKIMGKPQFCRDIANNIAAQIRSSGIQTKVHRAPVRKNSVRFRSRRWHSASGTFRSLNAGGIVDEHATDGPVNAQRWPASRVMEWDAAAGPSGRFIPNSPRLIHSAMNFLQAVNNSNGNRACTQPQGLAINNTTGLEQLLPTATLNTYLEAGYFVQASLKVQPYNIANDNLRACNPNIALRPFAATEPPRSDVLGITDNLAGRYDAMTGFKTEVFVTLDHPDPALRNAKDRIDCTAKHSFQYDRVVASIPAPRIDSSGNVAVILETQSQSYLGYGSGAGAGLNGTALATPIPFQPGLFLACAWEYNTVTPLSLPGPPVGNINQWGPCEDINVCGRVGARVIESPNGVRIQTNNSIPGNCLLNVRAIAFDSVGNTSTETASGCHASSCQQTTVTSTSGGGGSPPGGYQVNGVTFSGPNAAAMAGAAAALNGATAVPVDNPPPGSLANTAAMQAHVSAVGSVRGTNSTVSTNAASYNAVSAGITAATSARAPASGSPAARASASANLSAAQTNVANAAANVANARANQTAAANAQTAAAGMASSMNGVQAGAVTDADMAKAEADAALAEAEAALAAAQAAEAAAQAAKDAEDSAASSSP